jgi:hypothetical protein
VPGGTKTKKKKQDELPDLAGLDVSGQREPDSKLDEAVGAMEATQGGTSSFGEFDSANQAMETKNKSQGKTGDAVNDGKWGDNSSRNGIAVTAGVMSTFDLALDVTRAVKVFMDSDSSGLDKGGAVLSTLTSASKTAEGVGAIVKVGQENAGAATSVTEAANSIMGEITGILTVINAGYTLVKNIITLVQKGAEMNELEKRAKIGETVKAVLDAGKGTIDTINKFMAHLGTATGPMLQAAPGIGIAMNVLDVIMNGVNIGYSFASWAEMRDDKRVFKAKAKDYAGGKTFWGGNASYKDTAKANIKIADDADAAEAALARQDQITKDAAKKVADLQAEIKVLRAKRDAARLTSQRKKIQEQLDEKLLELKGAEAAHKTATGELNTASATATSKRAAATAKSDDIENSREYLLSKQLQEISAKRIQRGALNIGLALPAIAGDIAVLSGAGAAVGAGLKAGSGAGKLLAIGIRMGKQAYHNAKGDEKSAENKGKMYDGIIKGICGHVQAAHTKKDPELKAKALREISASGMTTSTMEALKPKGGEALYKAWVKALKTR